MRLSLSRSYSRGRLMRDATFEQPNLTHIHSTAVYTQKASVYLLSTLTPTTQETIRMTDSTQHYKCCTAGTYIYPSTALSLVICSSGIYSTMLCVLLLYTQAQCGLSPQVRYIYIY